MDEGRFSDAGIAVDPLDIIAVKESAVEFRKLVFPSDDLGDGGEIVPVSIG